MNQTAEQIHRVYSVKPGAREIVSRFALTTIWSLYLEKLPKRVIEVGAGIGCITQLLAEWKPGLTELIAVEDHPWCLEQAQVNLDRWAKKVLWYDRVPRYSEADLIIVDGPQIDAEDWAWIVAERALVIFEGNRREQRAIFHRAMDAQKRSWIPLHLKPGDRTKGVWVYQVEPTPREIWRFFWRMVREELKDWRARANGQVIGKRRRG